MLGDPDRQQRGLIATWTLWMAWFSWFFGANVLLLWNRPELVNRAPGLMAGLWIFYNASGALVAVLVAHYTLLVGRRCRDVGFPIRYAVISGVLNALALLGNCLMWGLILSRPP